MGRLAALGEPMMRFRARVAATPQLIALLSSDIKDYRVKRIIGLLEQMAPHCESISLSAAEIISICEADSVRFRGFHPRLTLLKEELSTARDVLVELSQRALLYLNHIKTVRYSSPPSTHRLAQSTITEIKAMGLKLSQTAREAIDISLTRPPGPAPMPYDDNQTITTVQLEWARGLCEGELSSVGHDYDARWDPDVKMPGTQHGKFLRFPGPFFAPFKNTNGSNFYEFSLPETSGHHIDLLILKYNNIETNFKRTNRFHPRRGNKESEKFKAHQANIGLSLAKSSGERYDPDSVVFYDIRRNQDISSTTGPYVNTNRQVRKSRLGTGVWAFEDMNRVLEVHHRGRNLVKAWDTGRVVLIDSRCF